MSSDKAAVEEAERKGKAMTAEGQQVDSRLRKVLQDAAHVLDAVENEERQARAVACRATGARRRCKLLIVGRGSRRVGHTLERGNVISELVNYRLLRRAVVVAVHRHSFYPIRFIGDVGGVAATPFE